MKMGYAAINLTLAARRVQVNRSMVKRTFIEKGLLYASELALANVTDLEKVIDWNTSNNIFFLQDEF
jgi:UV DNA damage endonuclease